MQRTGDAVAGLISGREAGCAMDSVLVGWIAQMAPLPGGGMAGIAGMLFSFCLCAGLFGSAWVRWGGLVLAGVSVFLLAQSGEYPGAWVGVSGGAAVLGWVIGDAIREHRG